jgi:hypothetical protein
VSDKLQSKCRCTECDAVVDRGDWDVVIDPRPLPGEQADEWAVCRNCRAPDKFVLLCDEPGCLRDVSCGTPTAEGYRHTCGDHQPTPDHDGWLRHAAAPSPQEKP